MKERVYLVAGNDCLVEVDVHRGSMRIVDGLSPSPYVMLFGNKLHYFDNEMKIAKSVNLRDHKFSEMQNVCDNNCLRERIREGRRKLSTIEDQRQTIADAIQLLSELRTVISKETPPSLTIELDDKLTSILVISLKIMSTKVCNMFGRAQRLGLKLMFTISNNNGLFRTKIVPLQLPLHISVTHDVSTVTSLAILFENNDLSVSYPLPFQIK